MKKVRALSCFILALGLLFYAAPRLPIEGFSEMATGFSLIWTSFALLVIGGNLQYVLRDGRRTRRRSKSVSFKQEQPNARVASKKRRVSIDL
ncbi:hypothetical protein BEP19_04895 [Ammoniphilus oxalaticus]|uniref:Uncharacterized protein n=1 Tax=Ammoniphilus oxalaticus TaxID=66863 RepID=A0A419SII6_9BACL|nr:hypothetical protein [Ammoniphilus oxalaticus]RKD23769.1 hypothetical protein BEP19_04895 [Ammoniphilus oxalaticus]